MGIVNLLPFIRKNVPGAVKYVQSIECLKGTTAAIDVSIYMYKFESFAKGMHINLFEEQYNDLKKAGVQPLYVFDGPAIQCKKELLEKRKKNKIAKEKKVQEKQMLIDSMRLECSTSIPSPPCYVKDFNVSVSQSAMETIFDEARKTRSLHPFQGNVFLLEDYCVFNNVFDDYKSRENNIREEEQLLTKMKQRILNVSTDHYNDLRKFFDDHSIPYVVGENDSERTCSILAQSQIVGFSITEDSDSLAMGCPLTLYKFASYKTPVGELISLHNVLSSLNLTYDSFVDFCILSGCDYGGKIKGISTMTGYKYMLKYKTIENLVSALPRFKQYFNQQEVSAARKQLCVEKSECIKMQKNWKTIVHHSENFIPAFSKAHHESLPLERHYS